jgi:hypothetical protein
VAPPACLLTVSTMEIYIIDALYTWAQEQKPTCITYLPPFSRFKNLLKSLGKKAESPQHGFSDTSRSGSIVLLFDNRLPMSSAAGTCREKEISNKSDDTLTVPL